MESKIDLLTGEKFQPKRKNQRFANPRNRIAYNNLKVQTEKESKPFIDKPLQCNHRILIELINPNEVKTFSKDFLNGKGYNFSVMSHYETYYDKVSPALYNFIFIDLGENKSTITIYRKK